MPRSHESRVDWKHLAVYGLAAAIVVCAGGLAIWSFVEKQTLVIQPEPLPRVTVVTDDARSPRAAAWVRLLTNAEMPATLVPLETFNPIEGVVVFCDVRAIPPRTAAAVESFVHRGGAVAFAGKPPEAAIGKVRLASEEGEGDEAMRLAESVSPLLARLNPGAEIAVRKQTVTFLKETPHMVVDARWKKSARAAVMHMEENGARYIWFGFDPDALANKDDPALFLLLRTSFRWVAGQPVSDGAIGSPQVAKTLTPAARRDARVNRFVFSVDRMRSRRMLSVRMANRGTTRLLNPTVKVWLPPRVTRVALAGDFIMRRNVTLIGVPEEGACLVSLPSLARNEVRSLKLKIEGVRDTLAAP